MEKPKWYWGVHFGSLFPSCNLGPKQKWDSPTHENVVAGTRELEMSSNGDRMIERIEIQSDLISNAIVVGHSVLE